MRMQTARSSGRVRASAKRTDSRVIFTPMADRHRRTTGACGVTAVVVAVALAGCGQSATSTTAPITVGAPHASISSTTPRRARALTRKHGRHSSSAGRHSPSASPHGSTSLAYSTASAHVVQPQPAPGSCHTIGTGLYSRPDPRCTPGALNPVVSQATISKTICVAGWTSSVRPSESVTESEKLASMAAYGDAGPPSVYEYDHFVPLELGGAVNDPRNLWPEPGASPNPKDAVEDELNHKVCDGEVTLVQAQRAITTNWTVLAARAPGTLRSSSRTASARSPSAGGAECTASASYNSTYHDYDVYVNSNQPDETVTVTDSAGHSDSWHTDSSGYADVYFHAGSDALGKTVTARVGGASCSTTL
jgi:hypothetical protein